MSILELRAAPGMVIPANRRYVSGNGATIVSWLRRVDNEVYDGLRSANRRPRIEPRERWQRRSSCAKPRTLVAGKPGDRFTLMVNYHAGRSHLPIVSLQRAA